ncbi:hypothetical protein [Streptomyces sp. NPDC055506]
MRKKVWGALGAVALAGVAFTSTPAIAVSPAAASSGDVSVRAACSAGGEKVKARESVKIRKAKSFSSTALGLFPKGKTACSYKNEKAKWYSPKCGQGSDQWDYISYSGTKGWVPTTCIELVV